MPRGNNRGWTWVDDSREENEGAVEELVSRWNALNNSIEARQFSWQLRMEDGDCGGEDDTDVGTKISAARKVQDELDLRTLQTIEDMLAEYGARLMRPYEHWNEEEQYREYMERDRGH